MSKLIVGNCLDILPTLEAGSIDACVTDPPYGIGFMGKEWDTFELKNIDVQRRRARKTFTEQVTNPNLKGRIGWMAGQPITYDESLNGNRKFQSWVESWAREILRVLKPGAHLLVCGAPRSFHRLTCGIEDAGFEIRDCIMWVFGSGFPKSHNLDGERKGWGTALKPAWEPIIVARKPLIGTVAENVQAHGTGAINIDGCRIDGAPAAGSGASGVFNLNAENDRPGHHRRGEASAERTYTDIGGTNFAMTPGPRGGDAKGRWPANLIHDGSDEVVALFPPQAGAMAPPSGNSLTIANTYSGAPGVRSMIYHGDTGSAARFYYCAKTSRQDRNEGCESIDKKPLNWSSGTQSPGTFQADGTDRSSQNNHPTVKPTDLMRYLLRLVTTPGGTVLDPFMGSGSTGKACVYEGFDFIGIEREAEYAAIAEARIAFAVQDHRGATAQQRMVFA